MYNLQLIPDFLYRQPIIKAVFAYDRELIALVKAQKGARWSQTLRSWYFPQKDFKLHAFCQALKSKAFVDYLALKKNLSPTPKNTTSKPSESSVVLPKAFIEKLILKRYSQNTVKTYCSCFLKFMLFFERTSIDLLSKKDIQEFILYLVQHEKVSPSTQNQYINAIKFYYEKVLNQPKIVFAIERPRKRNHLPKIISEHEVLGLLRATQNLKHKAITCLLYASGLRISEVIHLNVSDLDLTNHTILIKQSKGFKDRLSIMGEATALVLKKYLKIYQPKIHLFEGQFGGNYSPRSINKFLKQNAKKAGISVNI